MTNIPGKPKTTDEIFMDELKQEFMESVEKNLADIQQLYEERNYEEIIRIAHDIKGTAGVFGMDEGTDIARELQYAARNENVEKIKPLIDKLVAYMKEHGMQ